MNIFIYNTYKQFLKAFISRHDARGIISQIAAICGCDRTYISQVLNGKADLTPDHMIQFSEHYGLDEIESNYLLLLLLRDRSASLKVRRNLGIRLRTLKTEALTVSNKISSTESPQEITEELRTQYYTNWMYVAVHILTSIAEYQTQAAIAQKIHIPITTVNQVLKDLEAMRLVRAEKGRFVHSGGDVYLPRQSSQISAHHLGWRMKAVERSLEKDDVHYTSAFSVSTNDVEKLRIQIVDLIESQRLLVRNSGAEVACAFCVDFFAL